MLGTQTNRGRGKFRLKTELRIFALVLALVMAHPLVADAYIGFIGDSFVDVVWDSTCSFPGPCCDGVFQYYSVLRGESEIARVTTPASPPEKNVYRDTGLTPNQTYRYHVCCQTDQHRTCDTASGDEATPGTKLFGTLYRDATFEHGEYAVDTVAVAEPATLYLNDVTLYGAHSGDGYAAIGGWGGSLQIDRATIFQVGLSFRSSGTNFLRHSLIDWPADGLELRINEETHVDITDNPGIRVPAMGVSGSATITNNSFYGGNAAPDFGHSLLVISGAATVQQNRFYRFGISTNPTAAEIEIADNTFIGGAYDWFAPDHYQAAIAGWFAGGSISGNTFDAVEKPANQWRVGTHIGGYVSMSDNTVRGLDYGIIVEFRTSTIDQVNIFDNTITGNLEGIRLDSTAQSGPPPVTISGNCIEDNDTGLYVSSGVFQTDATDNWWGDPTGPTYSHNPGGRGDKIAGTDVRFSPVIASSNCHPGPVPTPAPWPGGTFTPEATTTPPQATSTPTPAAGDLRINCGDFALAQYKEHGTDCVYRRNPQSPIRVIVEHPASEQPLLLEVTDPGQVDNTTQTTQVSVPLSPTRTLFKVHVPDDGPVGIYHLRARILGDDANRVAELPIYVIFGLPASGSDERAMLQAYLYSRQGTRDEDSLSFFYRSGWIVKSEELYWEQVWEESTYVLDPFDPDLFGKLIQTIDGETSPNVVAAKAMHMISNLIFYTTPDRRKNVARMLKPVSVETMEDAYAGVETQALRGQCLDYAHSLAAVLRSVGIPARVATKIEAKFFSYHQWTEAYLRTPDLGQDHWFVYDAMDYTHAPHTVAGDLASGPAGMGTRASGGGPKNDYSVSGFEVLVGGPQWTADGGVFIDYTDLSTTRVGLRRLLDTEDILFEKCESGSYSALNCPDIDPPDSTPLLHVAFDRQAYHVGETVMLSARISNPDTTDRTADLAVRVYRRDVADDGRDAFGDPVLGIEGTGVLGSTLFEAGETVTVPAGESVERQYSFVAPSTASTNDAFGAEATAVGGGLDEIAFADLTINPAFDLSVSAPSSAPRNEPFTMTAALENPGLVAVNDLVLELTAPDFHQTADPLRREIPLLNPQGRVEFTWHLSPLRADIPAMQYLHFTVTSSNGGNQDLDVPVRLHVPAELAIDVVESPLQALLGQTFKVIYEVENVGDGPLTQVSATLAIPTGLTMIGSPARPIGDLAPGSAATVDWELVGSGVGTHELAVSARDGTQQHDATTTEMVEVYELLCTGDCNRDGAVTVDELVLGVRISLETASFGACPAFDRSLDSAVTIDELIQGVNAALSSCPESSTPTPTGLRPTSTRTVSPTPSHGAASPTHSAVPATPTRTATGRQPTPTPTRTATPTTTMGAGKMYCRTPQAPLSIPDNDLLGTSDDLIITDLARISALRVHLALSHSFVGDLQVYLTHFDEGERTATVALLDRPGLPASPDGCPNDHVATAFDDAAALVCETQCNSTSPAIGSTCRPNESLAAFTGNRVTGIWSLTVKDRSGGDTGSLTGWCLEASTTPEPTPAKAVAPEIIIFTCNDQNFCTVHLSEPFTLAFSYVDRNRNAGSWRLTATRDDGARFDMAQGTITPPDGGGTIAKRIEMDCPGSTCVTTLFTFEVVVTDDTGLSSDPAYVDVTVLGTASAAAAAAGKIE